MGLRGRLLAASSVLCLVISSIPSEVAAFDLSVDSGVTAAMATGSAPIFVGATVAAGGIWRFAEAHGLGLSLRATMVTPVAWPEPVGGVPFTSGGAHPSLQLLSAYRFVVGPRAPWGAQFAGGVGLGFWASCVRGDMCGGGGLATTTQGALRRRLGRSAVLVTGLELATQWGMENGVGTMVMPRLFAGIDNAF